MRSWRVSADEQPTADITEGMGHHRQSRDNKGRFLKSRAPATMPDFALLILEMDRKTGVMKRPDFEFATPAEALTMCDRAWHMVEDAIEDAQDEADFRPETG